MSTVQQRAGRGREGRKGTNTGGDSNEGQDRGTGGREEEGGRWAGVLRRGGGGEGGEAGDGVARGMERETYRVRGGSEVDEEEERVHRSGRRLGNNAIVLPPPWLRREGPVLLFIDLVKIKQS